ncbi:hybrid sensor histidine kinase/response regulator transcription factor [Phocaeicola dorei]|uniref:hybrid sensor histidine kinase/response regulator transcription factor n=3 Tax=Phocaeicola dorei TaxID=357276 RepID=UPI003DA5C746
MKATIASLIFLLLSLAVSSQTYKYIGIEEGLSNQKIYKIQKDARGYMWFLTHVGIDRYNGKEIKHYKLKEGDRELDPLLNINWTYLDKTGTLLVTGKQGRIFRYDSGHDRFVQIYSMYNYWNKDYHAFVRYSYIDQESNVWLCGKSAIHLFNIESGQKQRISNRLGNITCIEQINSEHFFIGTDKRIYLVKLENGNLKELSCGKLEMMDMHVHELYLHRTANKLFIGTFEKGVYIYDLNIQKIVRPEVELTDVNITRLSPLNTKELLVATEGAGVHKLNIDTYETEPYIIANYGSYNEMDGNIINDVYVDNEQRIWLSSYPTGITVRNNQYTNYNWIKHSIGNRQSLVNNQVNSIIEDSDGDLWFGTSNGISLYDSKQKQWRSFLSSFNHGLKNQNRIFITLCEVSPGIIWAGGYASGIFQITKKNGNIEYLTPAQSFHLNVRADKYIRDIKKDRYGCIWSGGYYNLKCFNLKTRQGRLYPGLGSVTAIEEKDSTSMWIGTSTNLFLLDRNSGKYNEIHLPGGATYIYTLHQENNGLLYIGTSGSGLFTYDPVKESISAHYHTENSPLVSNSIYVILPTKDGNILMSTENGISIFSPTNRQFRNWTRGQGLMSTCFNAGSGVLRANGNTVFGSTDGALEFPQNIEMPQTGDSHMIFSDFHIFYQTVYPNDPNSPLTKDIDQIEKLNLKYMQNTFSIRVSSINYDYPSDILYTWQLEGFYDGWTTPSDEGTIRFTNVAPGTYTLRVRSVSKEDNKHVLQERILKITVAHPVWLSFWAICIYVLTITSVTYVIFRLHSMRREKKASDERTRFFINTAHDIRTPLTLIKAPLEEIQQKENLSEESQANNMLTAMKNVDTLLRLTTNLINFSKANVYSSSLRISEHELNTYMEGICHAFYSYAEAKQIKLDYKSNFEYQNVWFDKEKMDSITKNLISNAIKYTPAHGEVHIIICHDKDNWSLEITDTGIGIPAKEQKKLFKLHFRGSNAINAKITGSGIGLMLVWKLVRIHKGKISIESVENKGTRVKVIFPQKQFRNQQVPTETVQQENVAPVSPSAVSPHTYKDLYRQHVQNTQRILVVEDNDDLREYLFHTLSEAYQVETCTNGKEALKIIPEFKPDLVLSDIMMPEMRGDELCSAIKNNILTSHIPVILLTALNDEKNIVEGLETGADKYLIKPFNIGILKASIANILTNRALLRRKYADMELHNDSISINYSNTLDQQFLEAVKETITENLDNSSFNVESLCASQNMSRSSFYNKLKALTDQAPADYIRLIRLKRAAQLLSEGQYNISEISDMTGFNDVKYFREVFKKYYKISPSGYSKGEMKEEPAKP